MNKPVFAMLLGAVLGAFDGLERAAFRTRGEAPKSSAIVPARR